MKTFREFMLIAEAVEDTFGSEEERKRVAERDAAQARRRAARTGMSPEVEEAENKRKAFEKAGLDPEEARRRAYRNVKGTNTNVSGEDIRSGSQARTQTPPRPSPRPPQQPAEASPPPPPRPPQQPPQSSTSPNPQRSSTKSSPKPQKSGGLGRRFVRGVGKTIGYGVANVAADELISKIPNQSTREKAQTAKDVAMTTSFLRTNPITALAMGAAGPSSAAAPGIRDVGAYRIQKRVGTEDPSAGFDRFLATGRNKQGLTYNDPKSQKIYAYRRDRVGSGKPEDKPIRVGAAKLGQEVVPVKWGSIAGEKKVGTPEQVASTRGVQQSRQVAARSGTYGTAKGSLLRGIGGTTTTSTDTKDNVFMSTGAGGQRRTVQLPSTQLTRDPKTGQQRVSDLAISKGQSIYIARPSVASRDKNVWKNIQRTLNIGGQRERDTAAAKREYRTALGRTQQYTRQLGISSQSAKRQNLPGYGSSPRRPAPVAARPAAKPTGAHYGKY